MRVHKYKAWHKKLKIMLVENYDDSVQMPQSEVWGNDWIQFWGALSELRDNPDIDLLLFTGMNDENGEEIVQDDIAEVTVLDYYSNESLTMEEGGTFIGEVVMHNFMWMVRAKDATNIPLADVMTDDMLIKILGNTHKNPELLKGA